MTLPDPPILVITDRQMATRPLPEVVGGALQGGCRWVLLREPDLTGDPLIALGTEIRALCRAAGATLSISADLDAAASIGADGLHLPQRLAGSDMVALARTRLGPEALIGISCHSLTEAEDAVAFGADYITLSPLFLTESKPGYGPALGTGLFRGISAQLPIPVLALGGIDDRNALDVRNVGAAGFAVMGTVMRAVDPAETASTLITAWQS